MTVRNGRPVRDTFDLAPTASLRRSQTQVKNFTDEAERSRVYEGGGAEVARSGKLPVLRCRGVRSHLRVSDADGHKAVNARPTVKGVHNATPRSPPAPAARDRRRRRSRAAHEETLRDHPVWPRFARGDGGSARHLRLRSIPKKDSSASNPLRTAPGSLPHRHDPAHAWFWFPQMTRDARWCSRSSIRCRQDVALSRHSAFDDPGTPAYAPARRVSRPALSRSSTNVKDTTT